MSSLSDGMRRVRLSYFLVTLISSIFLEIEFANLGFPKMSSKQLAEFSVEQADADSIIRRLIKRLSNTIPALTLPTEPVWMLWMLTRHLPLKYFQL